MRRRQLLALPALAAPRLARAASVEMRFGVFNVTSALPFHVAKERGIFARHGIEAVMVPLETPPLIVQAMVSEDIQATTNLVTIEGANIDLRRPGTVLYFSLNGQNAEYRMDQFLVRPGSGAKSIADLKGARIVSAPGPANMAAARGVLRTAGLEPGRDYTLTEQPMGMHVGALAAGSFDAAYTLEPVATIAVQRGVARLLEAGVISTHILGRTAAQTYAAGAAVTERVLRDKPEAARGVAAAWAEAIGVIAADPSVRELFVSRMNTPAEIAGTVPMQNFRMVRDFGAEDIADFQRFLDFGVAQGIIRGAVEAKALIRPL